MFKIILALVLAILSPAATVYAATTNANNFYFDDFTADYYLYRDEDGTSRMIVVENITAVFPNYSQNHGITRVIPFTNNDGKNLVMKSDDTIYIDVERNGEEEPVSKVEIGDGYFEVYIGDASKYVTGKQEYTLIYDFQNLILDFDEWQELYWDANGNDWQQRFNSVTARIHLDEDIADKFTGKTECYVGKYGETGQNRCETSTFTETIELDDGNLKSFGGTEFSSTGRLSAGETLTFVMQFDPNTFNAPQTHFDPFLLVVSIIMTLLAIVVVVLMILAWRSTSEKRKFYRDLFTKPEYTPLADLTVAEMAENYIGKGANGDKRVATLLDMAVTHKIEMIKTEVDGAFGKKKTQWKVRIKTDSLNKQQAIVLKILAGFDEPLKVSQEITIKSHSASNDLTKLASRFNENINEALERKGLREPKKAKKDPKTGRAPRNYVNILSVAVSVWVILGVGMLLLLGDYQPSYGVLIGEGTLHVYLIMLLIIVGLSGLIVVVKTSPYAKITTKGLEDSKYLEGLYLYMKMAEADRLKMLQSVKGADTSHAGIVKLYEKLLPYAVIFKLEKSWLDELGRYYEFDDVSAPAWYIGAGVFSARDFSAAMMAANTSVSNSIIHSTVSNSSSGVSGFGGGGFSGGGGGGGGGGGW